MTMPNTSKATKPAPTTKQLTDSTKAVIAKAGHNQPPKPNAEAVKTADAHLKAALLDARKATDKLDKTTLPKVAAAVIEYLTAKAAMRTNNKAQVSVTLKELRDHCYDLANYRRSDPDTGLDTSSASFEHLVARAIKGGMLVFEGHKQFAIDPKLGIAAPSNVLAPKIKAKNPVTNKWQEVDNMESSAQAVPIRVIEAEFAAKYGKEDKRATRQAKSTKDQGTVDVTQGNTSQQLTACAKLLHTLASKDYPLSSGQLDNIANIARDATAILDKQEKAA
jgi:hypothetical protein